MPSKSAARAATLKTQDPAIADVNRGVAVAPGAVGLTEDQRRAMGVDASQAEGAGTHDYSPEANAGATDGSSSIDTYAGMPSGQHPNYAGTGGQPLVMGQAPVAPARPMPGSPNANEKFDPDFPNAINQSPVVRGVTMDPRNDPGHPEHDQADPTHPDFGKPGFRHVGKRGDNLTYTDLKAQKAMETAKARRAPEPEAEGDAEKTAA